jgi:tRNA nucleotidyltransferase (CCA-adding enzyme)
MIPVSREVAQLTATLRAKGFEAFLVGGCVRDALLRKAPKDYDVATDALPEDVESIFGNRRVIRTGIAHGTVTVIIDNIPIEVTTYRIEGEYRDNRRPSHVAFTDSILHDLSRRDFTINAMAYSDADGLKDPFGGQADLNAGVLRAVGDPHRRFGEDALRIVRALRFASELGFVIEEHTAAAMHAHKVNLGSIAAERVSNELMRMLCGEHVRDVLVDYREIVAVVIPELRPAFDFDQHNFHHCHDVYRHLVEVTANVPPVPTLRLAGLLHDIGKPGLFSRGEDGVGHFYGHAAASCDIAKAVTERLKLDTKSKRLVADLVFRHDLLVETTEKAVKHIMNRYTPEFFLLLLDLKRADILGQHPDYWYRVIIIDELRKLYDKIMEEKSCFSIRDLNIDGNDLLKAGIAEGPAIGEILAECLNKVISGSVVNTHDALMDDILKNYKYNITGDDKIGE